MGSDTEDDEEEEGDSDSKDSNGNPLVDTVVTERDAKKADQENAVSVDSTASGVDVAVKSTAIGVDKHS